MILLALLAVCPFAYCVCSDPKALFHVHLPSKDAWKLFLKPLERFTSVYRSKKNDTELGGEFEVFQMKYYEADPVVEKVLNPPLF
uniref:Putative secreted protein n=1 Tax=Ixodes ricinus TaxID=34613 RepID=V5GGR4_IXORI